MAAIAWAMTAGLLARKLAAAADDEDGPTEEIGLPNRPLLLGVTFVLEEMCATGLLPLPLGETLLLLLLLADWDTPPPAPENGGMGGIGGMPPPPPPPPPPPVTFAISCVFDDDDEDDDYKSETEKKLSRYNE